MSSETNNTEKRFLVQKETGRIYIWTSHLAERSDMEEFVKKEIPDKRDDKSKKKKGSDKVIVKNAPRFSRLLSKRDRIKLLIGDE